MSALARLIRGLVSTTLPLSLLGCGSGDTCAPPTPIPLPTSDSCGPGGASCGCKAALAVEMCGAAPVTDAGISLCDPRCPREFRVRACLGYTPADCWVIGAQAGMIQVGCGAVVCDGRRPAGLLAATVRARNAVGFYAGRSAHLEAASVPAFEKLRAELRRLGAPKALANEAVRAARDEQRHARDMSALAGRFGASVPTVEIVPTPTRSLEEIAVENAIEGCTRELYGAAVAQWQAEAAEDEGFRRAMRFIAADELRHAELAFSIGEWAAAQLDDGARSRIAAARRAARLKFQREITAAPPPADLIRRAGLPGTKAALALLQGLSREQV